MKQKRTVLATAVLAALVLVWGPSSAAQQGLTRNYFVQAEDVVWDFAPTNENQIHGGPIPAPWTNSHTFAKVRYVEYTDDTFVTPKEQPPWLGILGPIIRAEVGDTVLVHFCNKSTRGSFGMHPHGFRYDKNNEGARYFPFGTGSQVPPGACFTYSWFADEGSGPGPDEPSSIVWWYHSHINEPAETNLGLLGPIVITRKGMANPYGAPRDVESEFVTMFFIFNEENGKERGLMHSINGYIFGNLPGLMMRNGEKVRWYLLGMGNEVDLHTPHWHGKTVTYNRRHTDVVELLPGSMATADMLADNPGTWLYHCHVADHIDAGMMAKFAILP